MEDAPVKPSPEPVKLALKQLGVSKAWMIGDTPDDVIASRTAGVLPFGVLTPADTSGAFTNRLLESGAARVYASWTELIGELP